MHLAEVGDHYLPVSRDGAVAWMAGLKHLDRRSIGRNSVGNEVTAKARGVSAISLLSNCTEFLGGEAGRRARISVEVPAFSWSVARVAGVFIDSGSLQACSEKPLDREDFLSKIMRGMNIRTFARISCYFLSVIAKSS